jgi:hypothetical protein
LANDFSKKLLTFSFNMGLGNIGNTGGNTPQVSTSAASGQFAGVRASCQIEVLGSDQSSCTLNAAIYGLPLSLMNQLTVIQGVYGTVGDNTVTVQAGDEQEGMTTVYSGHIISAWMDGSAQPRVPFRVVGQPEAYHRVKPTDATSVAGTADVATMMQKLAGTMGLTFENNNVSVKVSNPYLFGAAFTQAGQLARMAGIRMLVEKGKLAIWNPGMGRTSLGTGVTFSRTNMEVGYPMFSAPNIIVKAVFDPNINYGGIIGVQSDITAACGQWEVNKCLLELDSFMPKGNWFATMTGVKAGQQQVPSR